jgi:mannose-6-phosphate isomerase-like protein (cupin superfamily)
LGAETNDYQFKLVKLQGEFVWHDHKDTDEVFLVINGEMFVVPKGVEHITRAVNECHALIVEPRAVVNTGEAGGALTAHNDVWV